MATWVKSYDPSMANVPYFALQVRARALAIYIMSSDLELDDDIDIDSFD
jgi:hypothetical protein